jgi:hypothetical protein
MRIKRATQPQLAESAPVLSPERIADSRRIITAAEAVWNALAPLDDQAAARVLLASAVLLRCDKLVVDLAKNVVWRE